MFPEDLGGKVNSFTAEHLREVRTDAVELDKESQKMFHTITAQTLFCGKQGRPDILPTVLFLSMRVRDPDADGWEN